MIINCKNRCALFSVTIAAFCFPWIITYAILLTNLSDDSKEYTHVQQLYIVMISLFSFLFVTFAILIPYLAIKKKWCEPKHNQTIENAV